MAYKITVRKVNFPRSNRKNDEVKWLCDSLGLMSGRDTEDTSFKIMCELLSQCSRDRLVPTERLVESLRMDAPRINHHIRSLQDSGILFREKRKIALSGGSLTAALEEMRRESDALFDRMIEVSKKIDKKFGY